MKIFSIRDIVVVIAVMKWGVDGEYVYSEAELNEGREDAGTGWG